MPWQVAVPHARLPFLNVRTMKPVTGRPKKVCTEAASTAMAAPLVVARSDEAAAPMPAVEALLGPNVRIAQPFWKVDVTFTFAMFAEVLSSVRRQPQLLGCGLQLGGVQVEQCAEPAE